MSCPAARSSRTRPATAEPKPPTLATGASSAVATMTFTAGDYVDGQSANGTLDPRRDGRRDARNRRAQRVRRARAQHLRDARAPPQALETLVGVRFARAVEVDAVAS